MQKREDKEGDRIEKRVCEAVSCNQPLPLTPPPVYEVEYRRPLFIMLIHHYTVRRLVCSNEGQGRPSGTPLVPEARVAAR